MKATTVDVYKRQDKGVTSLEKEMGMEQDFEEAKARLHSLFTEMFPE